MNKVKIINDPVHGFISVPKSSWLEIIDHPYFQRLRRIQQLGLTHLVYPGALHTRFHHVLGAFHLMTSALETLKQKGVEITENEIEAAGIAILLHDIGHGPFSHTLEKTIVTECTHEDVSLVIMKSLKQLFGEKMNLAIEIFKKEYEKKFLCELVSSQLDVDRLDYLARDSFYTGVSEGVVGISRIIKMLNVYNNNLVVEHKGIYSIEKFLIARRIMYWQVYLHKTVISAEHLLLKILKRARELAKMQRELFTTPSLRYFLYNDVTINAFNENSKVLDRFALLDDHDIMVSIKMWMNDPDKILSTLSKCLINRKLYKTEISEKPFSLSKINDLKAKVSKKLGLSNQEAGYFVFSGSVRNAAYEPTNGNKINILYNDSTIADISAASDQYNISALTIPVQKYFLCFPHKFTDQEKV